MKANVTSTIREKLITLGVGLHQNEECNFQHESEVKSQLNKIKNVHFRNVTGTQRTTVSFSFRPIRKDELSKWPWQRLRHCESLHLQTIS